MYGGVKRSDQDVILGVSAQKLECLRPSTDTLIAPANLPNFKDYTLDSPVSS